MTYSNYSAEEAITILENSRHIECLSEEEKTLCLTYAMSIQRCYSDLTTLLPLTTLNHKLNKISQYL